MCSSFSCFYMDSNSQPHRFVSRFPRAFWWSLLVTYLMCFVPFNPLLCFAFLFCFDWVSTFLFVLLIPFERSASFFFLPSFVLCPFFKKMPPLFFGRNISNHWIKKGRTSPKEKKKEKKARKGKTKWVSDTFMYESPQRKFIQRVAANIFLRVKNPLRLHLFVVQQHFKLYRKYLIWSDRFIFSVVLWSRYLLLLLF